MKKLDFKALKLRPFDCSVLQKHLKQCRVRESSIYTEC